MIGIKLAGPESEKEKAMDQTMTPPESSPQEVFDALEQGGIILIDVREPSEYGAERIHGALLYPLSTFDAALLPTGGQPVVFHCGSGKRSAAAYQQCAMAGVTVRSHMAGGLMAWKAARLPVISVDPATGRMRDPA